MKSFKKSISIFLPLLAIIVLLSSCQKENINDTEQLVVENDLEFLQVSDAAKQKFAKLKYDPLEVQLERMKLPNGEKKEYYSIGDVLMNETELDELVENFSRDPEGKQYRRTYICSAPRLIRVRGVNTGTAALTARMRTGLSRAISNYNALGLEISFDLSFGPSADTDILVFRQASPLTTPLAQAGFPSGGEPFSFIRVLSASDGLNSDGMEHIMTHEIGHCIGMRHSDYLTRRSCGQGFRPESPATWIFGTSTAFQPNSVFNACIRSGTNGEFNANDIEALRRIY